MTTAAALTFNPTPEGYRLRRTLLPGGTLVLDRIAGLSLPVSDLVA
jgi:hypothetical protein